MSLKNLLFLTLKFLGIFSEMKVIINKCSEICSQFFLIIFFFFKYAGNESIFFLYCTFQIFKWPNEEKRKRNIFY